MKKIVFCFFFLVSVIASVSQGTRTTPHSRADGLLHAADQDTISHSFPVNIPMKPADLGNPPDVNRISQFGGDGTDVGQDVITDGSGNIYVTGYFSGPVNFGTVTLTSVGYTDGFLAKFSSGGILVWIRQLSCAPYEMVRGLGITLDLSGKVYITGSFNGAMLQIGSYSLFKTGTEDAFLARYDSSGMPILASHYGSYGSVLIGTRIAADAEGNCFIITGGESSLLYGGTSFVKYGIDGSWQWMYSNGAWFTDIKFNNFNAGIPFGNTSTEPALYLTGYITHNTDFGNTTLTANAVRNSPFLARFPVSDIYPDFEWAVQGVSVGTIGSAYNRAYSIAVDGSENIYFSGRLRRQLVFGEDTLVSSSLYVPYLVKCANNGTIEWARQGTVKYQASYNTYLNPVDITRDPSGNPLICYNLLSDSIEFGSHMLGGTGCGIVKYDIGGNEQWAIKKSDSPNGIDGTINDKISCTGSSAGGNILLQQNNAAGEEEWKVETAGHSGAAMVSNLDLDSQGNLYVYGKTDVSTNLFGRTTGTLLAKMKPDGDTLWTVPFAGGSFYTGEGNYLAIDRQDNVCVAGMFTDTLRIANEMLINTGVYIASFIVKINSSGNVMWLKQVGDGQSTVSINSLATDREDNLLASGVFSGLLTIGPYALTDAGYGDVFLAKYNMNGNLSWAKRAGGDNVEYSGFVAADSLDNIYLSGEFDSRTITIGSETVYLDNNDGDVILIKFTPGGQMIWFNTYGQAETDTLDRYSCWPNAIKTDAAGNSYIYGWTGPRNQYGPFLLESPYSFNFSLFKTNSSGIVQWAKIIREKSYGLQSMQIDLDPEGNCYIGGNLHDTIYFENNMVVNQGRNDLFVARYGNTGNFTWAKVFGSNPSGRPDGSNPGNNLYGIAVYNAASILVAGKFSNELDFDGTVLHSSNSNGFISLLGNDIPVGMSDPPEAETGFSVYPNPADDYLTVTFYDPAGSWKNRISVEIINLAGQTVAHREISSTLTPLMIDVHSLPTGMYFIKLNAGTRNKTGKFVKN